MKNTDLEKDELNRTELPLPEERFRGLGIASRATFFRWERDGLRVLRVGGRRFIYPSELRRFLECKNSTPKKGQNEVGISEEKKGAE